MKQKNNSLCVGIKELVLTEETQWILFKFKPNMIILFNLNIENSEQVIRINRFY